MKYKFFSGYYALIINFYVTKNTVSTAKLENELHQLHLKLKGIYFKPLQSNSRTQCSAIIAIQLHSNELIFS